MPPRINIACGRMKPKGILVSIFVQTDVVMLKPMFPCSQWEHLHRAQVTQAGVFATSTLTCSLGDFFFDLIVRVKCLNVHQSIQIVCRTNLNAQTNEIVNLQHAA